PLRQPLCGGRPAHCSEHSAGPAVSLVRACYLLSVLWLAASCSRIMVLTRAISLRRPRIFFRLSVCPMLSWNFSLKSWSASSCSWWRSSTSVRLRTFSDFIVSQFPVVIRVSSEFLRALRSWCAVAACATPDAWLPRLRSESPLPSRTKFCPDEPLQPNDRARPCLYPYEFRQASW